jgi:hypothetical protein
MLDVARHRALGRSGAVRDERRVGGCGCCFWGRSDTHLAGDGASLVTDAHAGESLAEIPRVAEVMVLRSSRYKHRLSGQWVRMVSRKGLIEIQLSVQIQHPLSDGVPHKYP